MYVIDSNMAPADMELTIYYPASETIDESLRKLDALPIKSQGLTIDDISTLISYVTDVSNKLTLYHKKHIMKNYLYFTEPIPSTLIVAIVSSLGFPNFRDSRRKIKEAIQVELCDWLVSVRHFLQDKQIYTKLYGILFNLVEFDFLREKLSYILFLVTTRKQITQSRKSHLLQLYDKFSNDIYIHALLTRYQQLSPEKITRRLAKITFNPFKASNIEYIETLSYLARSKGIISATIINEETVLTSEFSQAIKKRKTSAITTEISDDQISSFYSLEQLSNNIHKEKNYRNLHDLFLSPTQTRQLSFIFRANDDDLIDLDNWLLLTLESFETFDKSQRKRLIRNILEYTIKSLNLPSSVLNLFIKKYISSEDEMADLVWKFVELMKDEQHITSVIEIYLKSNQESMEYNIQFLKSISTCISNDLDSENKQQVLKSLKSIISTLINNIKRFEFHKKYLYSVVNFLLTIPQLPTELLTIDVLVLPPSLLYTLFLQNDPFITSKICQYLNESKDILNTTPPTEESTNLTMLHNSYVLDIINILWRDRAFSTSKTSLHPSIVFGITPDLLSSLEIKIPLFNLSLNSKSSFGLIHSPGFANLSARALRDLEKSTESCTVSLEGPLTETTLNDMLESGEPWLGMNYDQIKLHILGKLDELGFSGISDFLYGHLKSLSGRRKSTSGLE